MDNKNTISIDVSLDENNIPQKIEWKSNSSKNNSSDQYQEAKAVLLSFWDGEDKSALRLDLWTKTMTLDEMADFFFQTLMTMADTFKRANPNTILNEDIKFFAKDFFKKFNTESKKKQ